MKVVGDQKTLTPKQNKMLQVGKESFFCFCFFWFVRFSLRPILRNMFVTESSFGGSGVAQVGGKMVVLWL